MNAEQAAITFWGCTICLNIWMARKDKTQTVCWLCAAIAAWLNWRAAINQ